ncbi:MAG: hypothetical protein JSV94_02575 [Methanobacteriota archaeon]|nr:MAG: hypothetical protein JSV94_02575 [Euryarchaeota archaeon]
MNGNRKSTLIVAAVSIAMLMPGLLMVQGVRAETVSWTIAIYVNGDNDLEANWDDDSLPMLMDIPANSDLNLVAAVDRYSEDGCDLVEITEGSSQVVASYAEKNFGDDATLQWFITLMDTSYPSDNLAVVIWDHGGGWKWVSWDQGDDDDIYMPELYSAIANAGVYIDILGFDACNMAMMEVMYEVSLTGNVGYFVASEEYVPLEGFPYDLQLTPLAQDTSRTPAQVAVDMVNGYEAFYAPLAYTEVTLSAVDVTTLTNSFSTIDTWTDEMLEHEGQYAKAYATALRNSYAAWGTTKYVDMADLGDNLLAQSKITDSGLRTAIGDMVTLIDDAVLACYGHVSKAADARGVTIWWASKGDFSWYGEQYEEEVSFATDTSWLAFLDAYT